VNAETDGAVGPISYFFFEPPDPFPPDDPFVELVELDFFEDAVVDLRLPPIPLVPVGGFDGSAFMENMSEDDYECFVDADADTVAEVLREAESYLSAQLTAGIAADQRAMSLISLLAASAAAIAAGGGALLIGDSPSVITLAIGWTLLMTSAGLLVAMWYAIKSAMPADFEFVGNTPAGWLADVQAKQSLQRSLSQQIKHYAGMIEANNTTMKRNAQEMRMSVWWAWGSLVTGGAVSSFALAVRNTGIATSIFSWAHRALSC
jgi:hypothetical protein